VFNFAEQFNFKPYPDTNANSYSGAAALSSYPGIWLDQ